MSQRGSEGVITYEINERGDIVLGAFSGAVPTTASKFAIGCILVGSNGYVYTNAGTYLVPSFVRINSGGAYVVVYAGKHTTVGGAAAEDKAITGVIAGDIVIASLIQKGATPRTLLTTITATDKITLTFSGDPSTDHIVGYQILRAI